MPPRWFFSNACTRCTIAAVIHQRDGSRCPPQPPRLSGTHAASESRISDLGPDTDHVDCVCLFVVPSDYGYLLTRKSLRLQLIIQFVNVFDLGVVEHELCAINLNACEDAVFLAFGHANVMSFRA
jgi:hypothetical protein